MLETKRAAKGLRNWSYIYNYKGSNPDKQGNRLATAEQRYKGQIHLEYNPDKAKSRERKHTSCTNGSKMK